MKKFFVIPIMFIYLLAVSGIMVTVHYCGQEMESLSFFSKSDQCDENECNDEPGKSDGCCQDKTVAAKVTNDQNAVNSFKLKLQTAEAGIILASNQYIIQNDARSGSAVVLSYTANAPPGLWQSIPLFKLYSSFTYYG